MALDTRRYRERQAQQANMNIISSSIPGLVIISIAVLVIIVGIILMASFGVPKKPYSENLGVKKLSGPVTMGVGVLLTIIGICVAVTLKKGRKKKGLTKKNTSHRISPNAGELESA